MAAYTTLGLLATMTTLAFSRRPSLSFSDFGSDDEEHVDTNGADYSTRMGELFDDEDETPAVSVLRLDPDEDDENDEAFIYDGADAQVSRASYREQLRDVLDEDDGDADNDDDELEEREVEHSLVYDLDRPLIAIGDEALVSPLPLFVLIRHVCLTLISRGRTPSSSPCTFMVPRACYQPSTTQTLSPSTTSASFSSPPAMSSFLPNGASLSTPSKLSPSFLHPSTSRLRSYMTHASPVTSVASPNSPLHRISPSPSPSSFTLSPGSSSAHLPLGAAGKRDLSQANGHDSSYAREVFQWAQLHSLGTHLSPRHPSNKVQAMLGASAVGAPLVMAANGLICIGTESGRILVFDFKQTLRCICGDPSSGAFQTFTFPYLLSSSRIFRKDRWSGDCPRSLTRSHLCRSGSYNRSHPAL
jgi:vacuolar protein sorting-associated protein 8